METKTATITSYELTLAAPQISEDRFLIEWSIMVYEGLEEVALLIFTSEPHPVPVLGDPPGARGNYARVSMPSSSLGWYHDMLLMSDKPLMMYLAWEDSTLVTMVLKRGDEPVGEEDLRPKLLFEAGLS